MSDSAPQVVVVQDWQWKDNRWQPEILGVTDSDRRALQVALAHVRTWNLAREPQTRLVLPLDAIAAIRLYERAAKRRIGFTRTRYFGSALTAKRRVVLPEEFDEAPGETIDSTSIDLSSLKRP